MLYDGRNSRKLMRLTICEKCFNLGFKFISSLSTAQETRGTNYCSTYVHNMNGFPLYFSYVQL